MQVCNDFSRGNNNLVLILCELIVSQKNDEHYLIEVMVQYILVGEMKERKKNDRSITPKRYRRKGKEKVDKNHRSFRLCTSF